MCICYLLKRICVFVSKYEWHRALWSLQMNIYTIINIYVDGNGCDFIFIMLIVHNCFSFLSKMSITTVNKILILSIADVYWGIVVFIIKLCWTDYCFRTLITVTWRTLSNMAGFLTRHWLHQMVQNKMGKSVVLMRLKKRKQFFVLLQYGLQVWFMLLFLLSLLLSLPSKEVLWTGKFGLGFLFQLLLFNPSLASPLYFSFPSMTALLFP